jgi:hypothetical protein
MDLLSSNNLDIMLKNINRASKPETRRMSKAVLDTVRVDSEASDRVFCEAGRT